MSMVAGVAGFEKGRTLRMLSIGMPDRAEFVQEASSLITNEVEDLKG